MRTPAWRLRVATEADAAVLTDLVVAANEARTPLPTGEEGARWRESYAAWTRESARSGELSVVEDEEGLPIGRLRVRRAADRIELAGVQLRPEVQGRGIGTAIVRMLQREATERGVPLHLGVEKDNPRARALYERLGFVLLGESDDEHLLRWRRDGPFRASSR